MNYPLLCINNTLSNAYVYQSWENLASQVLALEQESYLPYIKKVIKKILQTTDPSHSTLEAVLFLLPNISYIILRTGYFCNLKTNQLKTKKELYYTNFILNVALLMSNTLNEQLAFILWILSHRVDWDFTFSALHIFGDGNKFIRIVKLFIPISKLKLK